MIPDPIVEDVRKIREAYAAKFNFDLHALCRDLREKEKDNRRVLVTFTARPEVAPNPLPAIPSDAPAPVR
jgi:hypothetical protein